MTTDALTRVMLVDDHLIMRDLLRDALEDTGEFEVVAQAADGEEALRMAEEATPDVIVMDIIMPVMDGIEACRKITERLPDTKVLMLTASNEKDAIVQSVGAGATGYLQKYSSKSSSWRPCERSPTVSFVYRGTRLGEYPRRYEARLQAPSQSSWTL